MIKRDTLAQVKLVIYEQLLLKTHKIKTQNKVLVSY